MAVHGTYEPVIGLEVHVQLSTNTKIFCGCSTEFGAPPNTQTCPVCLGLPGALPVLNEKVVEYAIRLGLATHSTIAARSIFARKNYFYPDLPKGYQISQFEHPICTNGTVEFTLESGEKRTVRLTRIHMEEDAGKSIHDAGPKTLIDVNRCGTPLLEVVTEPDFRTGEEASKYLQTIRQVVRYLGICDGNMEEGSLRCDANISIRKKGEQKLGVKTEVKNMNSFRNVERAIEAEIERQISLVEKGERIVQQTLLWDAANNSVVPMRSKEEAHDYRYFPDPDLPPVIVDEQWITKVRSAMPELPAAKRTRFAEQYHLSEYDTGILTEERDCAEYYERTVKGLSRNHDESAKLAANWIITELMRSVKETNTSFENFPVTAERLAALLNLILDGTISGKIAKEVFEEMRSLQEMPNAIVERKGLVQVSDTGLIGKEIDAILLRSANEVQRFRAGEQKLMGYFVGEIMKVMKGKANPKLVNEILRKKLEG